MIFCTMPGQGKLGPNPALVSKLVWYLGLISLKFLISAPTRACCAGLSCADVNSSQSKSTPSSLCAVQKIGQRFRESLHVARCQNVPAVVIGASAAANGYLHGYVLSVARLDKGVHRRVRQGHVSESINHRIADKYVDRVHALRNRVRPTCPVNVPRAILDVLRSRGNGWILTGRRRWRGSWCRRRYGRGRRCRRRRGSWCRRRRRRRSWCRCRCGRT